MGLKSHAYGIPFHLPNFQHRTLVHTEQRITVRPQICTVLCDLPHNLIS